MCGIQPIQNKSSNNRQGNAGSSKPCNGGQSNLIDGYTAQPAPAAIASCIMD